MYLLGIIYIGGLIHIWALLSLNSSRMVYVGLIQNKVFIMMKDHVHPEKQSASLIVFNSFWTTVELCGAEDISDYLVLYVTSWSPQQTAPNSQWTSCADVSWHHVCVCLFSVQPLNELKTQQKLWFSLLFSSSLSSFSYVHKAQIFPSRPNVLNSHVQYVSLNWLCVQSRCF